MHKLSGQVKNATFISKQGKIDITHVTFTLSFETLVGYE
jgi:hypothetical protein